MKLNRHNYRALRFEALEDRRVLAVTLELGSAVALAPHLNMNSPTDYWNVSEQPSAIQSEMTLEVNPTNPLHLAGFSHRRSFNPNNVPSPVPITDEDQIDLFQSFDGGVTWSTTTINDSTPNEFGSADRRFDPSIAFDTGGKLFVAYGHRVFATPGTPERDTLVVGRWDGDHFTFSSAASETGNGGLDKWHLATGPDGLGNQAVYVAYTEVVPAFPHPENFIMVTGSNDSSAAFEFEPPVQVAQTPVDTRKHELLFADPTVGPTGELYVSWIDLRYDFAADEVESGTIHIDRDLDGLFVGTLSFGNDMVVTDQLEKALYKTQVNAAPDNGIFAGPVLDIDPNRGEDGRLYLTWVDAVDKDTFNTTENSDVFLAYSDDQGASWTVRTVETSSGTDFLPWVDVDQVTGSVNVLYYTTDGDPSGRDDVHVRLATSLDGGDNFTYADLSALTSNETGGFSGDYLEYIGLAVHGGTAHALWASRVPVDSEHPTAIDLEALYASASVVSTNGDNLLTITGDDGGTMSNDVIRVELYDDNPNYLVVTFGEGEQAEIQFASLIATVNRIEIDSRQGDDTIQIDARIDVELLVHGGDGEDELTLIGHAGAPGAISTFEFFGDADNDIFTIDFVDGDPLPRPGFNFNFDGGAGADDVFAVDDSGTHDAYFVNLPTDDVDRSDDSRADSDSGTPDDQITLRSAVQQVMADGGNGYVFLPAFKNVVSGLFDPFLLTLTGMESDASWDLDITENITIIGSGAGASVVQAVGGSTATSDNRHFQVSGNAMLDIRRVTLTGGMASSAGSIRVEDGTSSTEFNTLLVTESAVVNNQGGANSGAIRVGGFSQASIIRSVVVNDKASVGGGIYAWAVADTGGSSLVTLDSSIVANNTATFMNMGHNLYSGMASMNYGLFESLGNNLLEIPNLSHVKFVDSEPGVRPGMKPTTSAPSTPTTS